MLKFLLRGNRITFYYSILIEGRLLSRYAPLEGEGVMVGIDDGIVHETSKGKGDLRCYQTGEHCGH